MNDPHAIANSVLTSQGLQSLHWAMLLVTLAPPGCSGIFWALLQFNTAMENCLFIDYLPIRNPDFPDSGISVAVLNNQKVNVFAPTADLQVVAVS